MPASTDPGFAAAREAFVTGCLVLGLGPHHADHVAAVFEDVLPVLGHGLPQGEEELRFFAHRWLRATGSGRLDDRERIQMIVRDLFLTRMVTAHDKFRSPERARET